MKKLYHIGEYAIGGTLEVQILSDAVKVIVKKYKTNKKIDDYVTNDFYKLNSYLNEVTSCYYADQILEWIDNNSKIFERKSYVF